MTTDINIPAATYHNGSRRRRHFSGYRRFKVIFLALGITGLVIGLGLLAGSLCQENIKLCKLGVIYVTTSLVLLGFRGIMIYTGHSGK